ncbi:MAG TPA: DUF3106 domain-containing protein [Candidatus Acidoferrales bacterium]|nr:DUF3106 domain-containing protein [Candidatus Acidoferrales bacterium]
MRDRRFHLARSLALLLIVGAATPALWAQRGAGQGKEKGQHRPAQPKRNPAPRETGGAKKEQHERRPAMGLPPGWMERVQEMSPGEQGRFLSNNERFRSLPPERQAQIRKRLEQWNSLSPEQRAAVRERERVWRQLTPEQKQYVREQLLPQWERLPPDRRKVILEKLASLRGLDDRARSAKLSDEAFLEGLHPDERTMLRDLSRLRVGSPPQPSPDNP